jgi:Ca-activated chloride channel homolog
MILAHLQFLWLLPIAFVQLPLALRSRGNRRWISAWLRFGCAAAVVLALCEPMLFRANPDRPSVILLDVGSEIPAHGLAEQLPGAKQLSGYTHIIAFSNRCEVVDDVSTLTDPSRLADLKSRLDRPLWPDDPPGGGSNLAAALRLAGAELDGRGGGLVELIASGRSTRGDAEAEAYRLALKGIDIHVKSLGLQPASPHSLIVRSFDAPPSVGLGEAIPLGVTVESAEPEQVNLAIASQERIVFRCDAPVLAGVNHFSIPVAAQTAGLFPLRVIAEASPNAQGSSLTAATFVDRATQVLVVKPDGGESAPAQVLRQILGAGASVQEVSLADLDRESLDQVNVLVLADVPIDHISHSSQQKILSREKEGMGLLVAGGSDSFSAAAEDDSDIAVMLPVKTDQQMQRIDPSVALVLIIDTSGSMEGEKLDLAKEVARLAISHLDRRDKVGLVEFYGGKRWAAPIQSAANAAVIDRALARFTAGGSTVLYPAVEEADFALRNVSARAKHVLIISDGFVEVAPFAPLVRSMAESGVAVSTVGVKTNPQERNLMPSIALWGRGRYYTVPDRFAVPDIALKQQEQNIVPSMLTTRSSIAGGDDMLLRPIDSKDFGTIDGYVRTIARSNADVLLQTASGDPILARWRYGAGWTAALTTELGTAYTADLQKRPAFAKLLTELLRQISGRSENSLKLQPIVRPAGVELDITATGLDAAASSQPLHVSIADPQGRVVREVDTGPIAVAHWNILLVGLPAGSYRATADGVDSLTGSCGFALNPPATVASLVPDAQFGERLQRFAELAAKSRSNQSATQWVDLTGPLVLLGMLLLLLHIGWRRLPVALPVTQVLEPLEQAA